VSDDFSYLTCTMEFLLRVDPMLTLLTLILDSLKIWETF